MNPEHIQIIKIAVLALLLAVAVFTDLRTGKIYNWLTLPAIALGITLNVGESGLSGFVQSLVGIVFILVIYLFFAPAAGIGGGDTKLMMAIGAVVGFWLMLWIALYSAAIGGVLALVVMARHRALLSTTRNMWSNLFMKFACRVPTQLSSGSKGIKFRYSPAIALGTILVFLIRG